MNSKAYRLPSHVIPHAYQIELHLQFDQPTFQGRTTTSLEILQPTHEIQMHAHELEIDRAYVTHGLNTIALIVNYDVPNKYVALRAEELIEAGEATLIIEYKGHLQSGMSGLYLAKDQRDHALCTQCQAVGARAIFPCFDEPAFKASLQWTLHTPKGVIALTNGPLLKKEELESSVVWRYAPTRKISSYLAALVVGDFEHLETLSVHNIPIQVYAPKGKAEQTHFAKEYAGRLLPFYEDYFAVPYPYTKYDQIGVPGFDAGAMENIGLVIFRQSALLMDPKTTSWRQEKRVALVVAHEFAHMWFGNWVTLQWWDDLWLNEAFAEWMANKAMHALSPHYEVWDDFQEAKSHAMADDALISTHSIFTPVHTPEEAIEMFDSITYEKGCAVMRMLESSMGEEVFRNGLQHYMHEFGEKNATGKDLWLKLEQASGQPIASLMQSWVSQPGFPQIEFFIDRDSQGNLLPDVRLHQRRFFSDPREMAKKNQQLWQVPLILKYEDSKGVKEHRTLFSTEEGLIKLPVEGQLKWVYANAEEVGFYRTLPRGEARSALLFYGPTVLSPVEQRGMIEDSWAFVKNGSLTVEEFLPLIGSFATAEHHAVLRSVTDRLHMFCHVLKDSTLHESLSHLRAWVRDLFLKRLHEMGFETREGESQNQIQCRSLLAVAVAKLAEEPSSIHSIAAQAERERLEPTSVDANLAGPYANIAAHFGDEDLYERFLETLLLRQKNGSSPQEISRYLYSLATFRNEAAVKKTLSLLTDEIIPQESIGTVLGQLLGARHSQIIAWEYLKTHFSELQKKVGDMSIPRLVETVGSLPFSYRADVVEFFEKNPPLRAERALSRAVEQIDLYEELRLRINPSLANHLMAR